MGVPCMGGHERRSTFWCCYGYHGMFMLGAVLITSSVATAIPIFTAKVCEYRTNSTIFECIQQNETSMPSSFRSNTTSIDMHSNRITAIRPTALEDLSALTALYMYNNFITSIPTGALKSLPALTEIRVQTNNITFIQDDAFQGLTSLNFLVINSNQITSIGLTAFHGLTSLWYLYMNSNAITSLPPNCFEGLSVLWTIYLHDNRLMRIESNTFSGLSGLNFLSLQNNQITNIAYDAFRFLITLDHLDLGNNLITRIDNRTFTGSTNLTFISLANNHVTMIADGSFSAMTVLHTLDLSGNKLNAIINSVSPITRSDLERIDDLRLGLAFDTVSFTQAMSPTSNVDHLTWGNRSNWAVGQDYSISPVELMNLNYYPSNYFKNHDLILMLAIDPSDLTYSLRPCPNGAGIDSGSGRIVITPRGPPQNFTTTVYTVLIGSSGVGTSIAIGTIQFNILYADDHYPQNGPNGQNCSHGRVVDLVEFDDHFTCDCANSGYIGDNCHVYQGLEFDSVTQYQPEQNSGQALLDWGARSRFAIGSEYNFAPVNVSGPRYHGIGVNMSQLTFTLNPCPPGFGINPATGSIHGVVSAQSSPTITRRRTRSFVYAVLIGQPGANSSTVIGSIAFDFQYPDGHFPTNGPHGRQCKHGTIVDTIEFDSAFACNCSNSGGYFGDNCELYDGLQIDHVAQYHSHEGTSILLEWNNRQHYAIGKTYTFAPVNISGIRFDGHDIDNSKLSYTVSPCPDGFGINPSTGEITGVPQQVKNILSIVYVVYVGESGLGTTAVIGNISFNFLHSDGSNPVNGPNGYTCAHGNIEDLIEFDNNFGCECMEGFIGSNCEIALSPTSDSSLIFKATLPVVAAAILLVSIGMVLIKARKTLLKRKVESTLFRRASGSAIATREETTSSMFDALDHRLDHLVSMFLSLGANPASRHFKTHMLVHAIVLSRDDVDVELLQELFRDHFEIDKQVGTLIQDPKKHTALLEVMVSLVEQGWRATSGGSVIHQIVKACQQECLNESNAVAIASALLDVDPQLLTIKDDFSHTAADLAADCRDARELEKLLSVVVFERYKLLDADSHKHRSETSIVTACRDLEDENIDSNGDMLVLKMLKDEASWEKELLSREILTKSTAFAGAFVDVKSVACVGELTSARELCNKVPDIQITSFEAVKTTRHQIAFDLMCEYKYAICMPMAERNLLEIIQSERFAGLPLSIVGYAARKIADSISQFHNAGLIHADIKPRNIVRSMDNSYKLIDYDMTFSVREGFDVSIGGLKKLQQSNAYSCPELVSWGSANPSANTDLQSILTTLGGPRAIDLFSFGVTLYELVTGVPLFENSYDRLTTRSMKEVMYWKGLGGDAEKQIMLSHPNEDVTPTVDVLRWLLDPDPQKRPQSMDVVMGHAFFDTKRGALREHFLIDEIRKRLSDRKTIRDFGRIMVSYSWDDTSFVLNKLVMTLAPRCRWLWLDKLGGNQGMSEWMRHSMQRGIREADVVIAVLSPSYVESKSCGYEMACAAELGKPVIPICLGLPLSQWPPSIVGDTVMTSQFVSPNDPNDQKVFVDFGSIQLFESKFNHELAPRLMQSCFGANANPSQKARIHGSGRSWVMNNPAFNSDHYEGDDQDDPLLDFTGV